MGYAIIGSIIAILAYISSRIRSTPIRFIFGLSWFAGLIFYNYNRPTSLIAGSPQDVAVFVIIIGIALIICTWAFTSNIRLEEKITLPNGSIKSISREHIKFETPEWLKGLNSTNNNDDFTTRFKRTYNASEYRARNHRALFQRETKRRNK